MRGIYAIGPSNGGQSDSGDEPRLVWVARFGKPRPAALFYGVDALSTVQKILTQSLFPRLGMDARDPLVTLSREDRIRRADRRPWVLAARYRDHCRVCSGACYDRPSEVEPCAFRVVRIVDDATRVRLLVRQPRHTNDGLGQVRRVRRPAA